MPLRSILQSRSSASLCTDSSINFSMMLNDLRRLRNVLAEDMTLEEVGQPHSQLVMQKLFGRNGEDLCKNVSIDVEL